jgi:ketosteroid isomerase-like protein
MKNFSRFYFLILTILFSCEPQNKDFKLEDVKAFINRSNKIYNERYLVNDINITNQKYCKDACIMPTKSPKICGTPGISVHYFNDGKNHDLNIEVVAKNIYGGPVYVNEEGVYKIDDKNGKTLDVGKFIAIWKQENKSWKLYREIWNTDIDSTNLLSSYYFE